MNNKLNFARYFSIEEYKNNASGQFLNAEGNWGESEEQYLATGKMQAQPQISRSAPVIVKITNTTTDAISNPVIFDALVRLAGGTATGNITYTSITGTNYLTTLYWLLTNPFRVGMTRLYSATTGQLDETIKIEYATQDGKGVYEVINFEQSENQYQTTRVASMREYDMNATTKFTLSSLLASASLKISLYPVESRNYGTFKNPVAEQHSQPQIGTPVAMVVRK